MYISRVISLEDTNKEARNIEKEISDNINDLSKQGHKLISTSTINHDGTTTHILVVFEMAE